MGSRGKKPIGWGGKPSCPQTLSGARTDLALGGNWGKHGTEKKLARFNREERQPPRSKEKEKMQVGKKTHPKKGRGPRGDESLVTKKKVGGKKMFGGKERGLLKKKRRKKTMKQ